MPNNEYANEPNQSRSEDIIQSILDNTEYDEEARSRIEYLLIELKNAIEGGGGGGGVTSYAPLTEKPKIDNHTLQAGNNTSSDLGLQTKLTFDSAPTENSTNPVTSGGVYTALDSKANSSDVYNKSAVDTALTAKADKSTTYTKPEVDTALSSKQNTISDLSTIRSGAALGATAVQPVSGKSLSTNDYTTAEKTKLAGIAEGAEVNEIEGIKVNNTTINPDSNKVVNITVPTTAADVSALPDTTKYATALSLTINSSTFVMTGQLKDQNGDNLGTAQTIDLPLESVVVGGSYNSQTKNVVLTLQNGNTIEFSVADLVSGLQTELSESNKLNPAYIDYDSTHRAVSDTEKTTWNGKQNALSSKQLSAVNSGVTSADVEQITTNKNNILSLTENGGGLNILDIQNPVTHIKTSYTLLSNGGVELSCSAPDSAWTNYNIADIPCITGKTYKVYIYIDEVSANPVAFRVYLRQDNSNGENYIDQRITQTGCISYTITAATNKFWAGIYLNNSDTARTVTTKMRMMIVQSDTDVPYQPYAMSNAELTAKEQTNKNNILYITDWLNSLNRNLSPIYGGISDANKFIVNDTAITLPAGTYTISWISAAKTGSTVVSVFSGTSRVVNQSVSNATDGSCTFTIASACDKFNLYTSVANTISNLKIIASS